MELRELRGNVTELVLGLKDWHVRMKIRGPGNARERRQLAVAIFEVISKVFETFENRSWITHPEGYWANIERDQQRGLVKGRGPNIETPAGKKGFEIRMERLKHGWTQEILAEKAGIDRSHLSWIERGRAYITDGTYLKIRDAFERDPVLPSPQEPEMEQGSRT